MNFNTLMAELTRGSFGNFGLSDLVVSLIFPAVLCVGIVFTYRKVQMHNSYSPSFLLALYLLSALSGGVTLFIGDNIARAFGLIGAMSIIRFRNALKEPIDAVFVLWTLAVGMSSGAGYYMAAACLTLVTSLIAVTVKYLGLAEFGQARSFLKVTAGSAHDAQERIERTLAEATREYKVLHQLQSPEVGTETKVYTLLPKKNISLEEIGSRLSKISGVTVGQTMYRPMGRFAE
ncbi:MAG: DUF4956 domain-containing protein [Proteobacteria bacterium]|nr:DUF4956 domain-containing protein [Pseudomonadota bacterium]